MRTTATNVRRVPGEGFCIFCRRRVVNHVADVVFGDGRQPDLVSGAATLARDGAYFLCAGRGGPGAVLKPSMRAGGICNGARRALEEGARPVGAACFSSCRTWRYWLTRAWATARKAQETA